MKNSNDRLINRLISRRTATRQTLTRLAGSASLIWGLNHIPRAAAQSAAGSPRKLLQIFLLGGWDSALASDPVIPGGGKFAATTYDSRYKLSTHAEFLGAPSQVPGKNSLWIGPGLTPALSALGQIPMALVNGLKVEVTAHELAMNYLYSGQMSLSRSREFAALIATMADRKGGFPAHVVLGQGIPLAETGVNNPPLQAIDTTLLSSMLAGPYSSDSLKPRTVEKAHELIGKLNANFEARQPLAAKGSLTAWRSGEAGLQGLYAKRFDQQLSLTPALQSQFATGGKTDSPGAKLAVAAMALKSQLTQYVTVNFGGFDTHSNHHSMHLPLMRGFATSLAGLIDYLNTQSDPSDPTKKLSETTTVLITSEFVRTPKFNGAGGTDHWQSGSAILLGCGVADNSVFGTTDDHGVAEPFKGRPLMPEHLAAAILNAFGYRDEAKHISEDQINGLLA